MFEFRKKKQDFTVPLLASARDTHSASSYDDNTHNLNSETKEQSSPSNSNLLTISGSESENEVKDNSVFQKIDLTSQSLVILSQLFEKSGYSLPKDSQEIFSTDKLPEHLRDFEEDINLLHDQIFLRNPQLSNLIKQLESKRKKPKPHERHRYLYFILAFLSFVSIAGLLPFTKFNWDLLEETINGTDTTPSLVSDSWQGYFFYLRILLVGLDLGARVCVIDFLKSPQTFIAHYCQCDHDSKNNNSVTELPKRSIFSKIMEFLIVDFMPFTLPFIQYAVACIFDIKGINSAIGRTWYRHVLNILSVLSTPIYFLMMYVSNKEEFRNRVRAWFKESNEKTDVQHPPSSTIRFVRLYDFSKTSFVYTIIQIAVYLFAADQAARMLSQWWWERYSSDLDYSFQALVGVSTLCSTIDSQILRRFDSVYIPSSDYDRFHKFFQNHNLSSWLKRWAMIVILGVASSFLPAWGVFQIFSKINIFNYMLSLVAGTPFFILEYFSINNSEKISTYNRHKEIKDLYENLEKDNFLVSLNLITKSSQRQHISASMINETYRKMKVLVRFFSDLPDKAYAIFPITIKETVSDLRGFLNEHCSRYEKLLLLYRRQLKSVNTSSTNEMYENIAKLYEDYQRGDAPSLPDVHSFNTILTTLFNVGSQVLHQISLVAFFRTVTEKYFYISNQAAIASALSIGTQFSVQMASNYQGWISTGVSVWSGRFKHVAGKAKGKFCDDSKHRENLSKSQVMMISPSFEN